ncbi:MAG: aldehyde dehydrogenase family protein [Actinomycetota bacterium]|nr:aldehyde dehydrogenase family protein [Actinomycetota bacterium]
MAQQVTYTSTDLGSEELDTAYDRAIEDARRSFPRRVRGDIASQAPPVVRVTDDLYPGDTDVVVAEVEETSPDQLDRAVAAARRSFEAWGRTPWPERVAALLRVADRIEGDRLALAAAMAWETGKVRVEAVGEVDEAVELIRYYARCVEAADGFAVPMGTAEERAESVLRPWGVWGVISPFNFPLALATGMVAGALLGGNTVVFKPATEAALTGSLLHGHLKAELPPDVVQLVLGGGEEIGAAMVGRPDLDGFAFTGSREVGLSSIAGFAATRPRPFVAEMGGKNAVIVAASADLDDATSGIVRSAFSFSGQKCSATSRVYVDRSRHDELLDRLRAATASIVVDEPHRRETFVGPVIDERARGRFMTAVQEAGRSGRIVAGGGLPGDERLARGHYVEPTVVTDLPLDHPHFREELFMPYVTVAPVTSLDEALREANAVPFGLTAGIFTEDPAESERFLEEIQAGTVYVNRARGATSGAWPGVQPFGGWKDSGSTGRHALGPRYVEQFMREQSRTVAR